MGIPTVCLRLKTGWGRGFPRAYALVLPLAQEKNKNPALDTPLTHKLKMPRSSGLWAAPNLFGIASSGVEGSSYSRLKWELNMLRSSESVAFDFKPLAS